MTDKLNAALQELHQAIAANAPAATVIGSEALETRFHGLTLRQLVLLTQAPVLAVRDVRRLPDGARVEQFSIDGRDEDRCELAGRDLILADQAEGGAAGTVREIRIAREGAPEHSLVVDRNDIVYRVTDREAIIDQDLTAELRARRQSAAASNQPESPAQEPIIINDSLGFRGIAGQVLHGLSGVRARNGVALHEIEKLVRSSGEQSLQGACQVASPDALLATFGRIISASQQIDALLEALGQRARLLLSLVEPSAAKPANGARPPMPDDQFVPSPNPGFSIEGIQGAKV